MLEAALAPSADDGGRCLHLDVRRGLDRLDQVVRHAGLQRLAAHDHRHAARVAGEVERRLAGGVPAADDVDLLAGQRGGLRGRAAVEHARADELLERLDAEAAVGRAGGEDHDAGADEPAVGERQVEPAGGAVERRHAVHEQEGGAEGHRLLVRLFREPAAADALAEAEVVADQRARRRLSADAAGVHDEDAQPLGGGVHGGGEARRAGADDHDLVGLLVEIHRCAGGLGDLGVRRVAEHRAVREDHHRQLGVRPRLRHQGAALVGVREAEVVRDGAAPEDLPELERPAGPLLADDVDRLRDEVLLARPLEQEVGDRLVEHLVGRGGRPVHVVVDPAECHRRADRVRGRLVHPGVRRDQQGALRMRVEPADVLEELAVSGRGGRLADQNERHLAAVLVQLGECPQRLGRIAEALDPVLAAVPLRQLRGDVLERVLVDGDAGRGAGLPSGSTYRGDRRGVEVRPLRGVRISRWKRSSIA